MHRRAPQLTRRTWFQTTSALALTAPATVIAAQTARPKTAVVFTELRHRSHAYNFLVNLMGTYLFRGQRIDPGVDVVGFYADQFPNGDMAREASRRFSVPLFKTIEEALCLGGKALAVDAILLIGGHGDY